MKDLFPHYYKPNEDELSMLWKEGIFILDANVILDIFRTPKEMSSDLMQIFEYLSKEDRLWVPYQAALEYQQNLLGEIEDQVEKRYSLVKQHIESVKNNACKKLKSSLADLKMAERHFFIDPDQLVAEAEECFGKLFDKLEELRHQHINDAVYDELRDKLDHILNGKIGLPPESQDWLDDIYDEGEKRYKKGIPPGFGDMKKSEDKAYVYNGLSFKRKYGDLILWKQIIKKARESDNFKYIAFVTGDINKGDWWWLSGTKSIPVGPVPELIREISSEADVSLFYMYEPKGFMEFAHKHLPIDENQKALEQAEHVAQERRANLQPVFPDPASVSTAGLTIPPAGVVSAVFTTAAALANNSPAVEMGEIPVLVTPFIWAKDTTKGLAPNGTRRFVQSESDE